MDIRCSRCRQQLDEESIKLGRKQCRYCRTYNKTYNKLRYERAKESGTCASCGKLLDDKTHARCKECIQKNKEARLRTYLKHSDKYDRHGNVRKEVV